MSGIADRITRHCRVTMTINRVWHERSESAARRFNDRCQTAYRQQLADFIGSIADPWRLWTDWQQYVTDCWQRSILFWDTLRQRGDNFVEHERAGMPPVLHFAYETILDAREFERPANYALLRIVPPEGVRVDPKRRPYIIIDPRAGHGPGIGGFKDDSQVGVALRDGHPVYFVAFFPQPEPGQTLIDVCDAEARFVHKVRELHADSPRPVIVGNCQGGWAAMMLAAANPDVTGPIVINGAPMSYWAGAWSDGEGDNPMRYLGGILGGAWLASLVADLGHGVFDGAYLVQNFESLNPANTFWDKYYHLYANVDSEPPRFLEFERWWGGFYLLNREEIEWIVENLFVGNKLWSSKDGSAGGRFFDLREIKVPIILFASLGDNITPPQQAFNWVADVYGSTDEIKARGQIIVGLLHENVGHLGIFVSGRVAQKEHTQIVSVMKSIEALRPGLYAMKITESKDTDGKPAYEVEFAEHRLEDLAPRLNRFNRVDEKAFEAAAAVSEFNRRAYARLAQPLVQALSSQAGAELGRKFHPLRVERWAISDHNPWLWWLEPLAESVKRHRHPTPPGQTIRKVERMTSEVVSASFDLYRDMRDAMSETLFFHVYGHLFLAYMGDTHALEPLDEAQTPDGRDLPFVRETLDSMAVGGYPEALTRVGALLIPHGQPIALSQLESKEELLAAYRDWLPDLPRDQLRRIRGQQEIIVQYEPQQAIETLPRLLRDQTDRDRILTLLDRLLSDTRLPVKVSTVEQHARLDRIRQVLSTKVNEPTQPTTTRSHGLLQQSDIR